VIAFAALGRSMGGFPARATLLGLWRPLLASVIMGEVVWLLTRPIGGDTGAGALVRLLAGTVVGVFVYVGLLALQGAPELTMLRGAVDSFRRRWSRRAPGPNAAAVDPSIDMSVDM